MSTDGVPSLPENYSFTDPDLIFPSEVIGLRTASNWGTETNPEVWSDALFQSLGVVGVRTDKRELVGIGFLVGNIRHALLCDFTVHPDHRNQGIGTAILEARINLADKMGVSYIYADIADTNEIRQKYFELGFVAADSMLERKSR